ncbi:MAG TPA: multicopper oxidase family protein [Aliidongia sp.]|nr:multicopper oxidase family protein [Aliidongia sp.]
MRAILGLLLLVIISFPRQPAWADADEYAGQDWQPVSTAAHPCGIGLPQRGNFPHDRWVNARQPTIKLVVKQEGTRLCYVIDGIAEAPVIRVRQGETLAITVRNEITDPAALAQLLPAGKLDRPNPRVPDAARMVPVTPGTAHAPTGRTNLHVHGFAVPPTVPQDEVLMGCADPAGGDGSCGQREISYRYTVPADMSPGLYWYHPHVHGEVQAQMLAGLAGAIVVEGPEDDAREAAGIPDRVFIVRQEQDADSKGLPPTSGAPVRGVSVAAIAPKPIDPVVGGMRVDTSHELGCTDAAAIDEITLNGAPVVDGPAADQDLAPLHIDQGTTQLWRVLNAATDAFLDLALVDEDGRKVPVKLVARDGAPVTDDAGKPLPLRPTTEAQLVPPAGRVEFLVTAPPLDRKLYLVSHAVDTGCAGDRVPERRLALLTTLPYKDAPAEALKPLTAEPSEPGPFAGLLARKTDRTRVIAFAEYPRPGNDDQTDFYIAERRKGGNFTPFEMDRPPAIMVPAGSVEEWVIENWTNEAHAFHIHQVHFRVLEVNGQAVAAPPLLDTVSVAPAAPADVTARDRVAPGRVRIKLYFPASLAGDIPFHCHLVDHEDNGMMGVVRVVPNESTAPHAGQQRAALPGFDQTPRSSICRAPAQQQSQAMAAGWWEDLLDRLSGM